MMANEHTDHREHVAVRPFGMRFLQPPIRPLLVAPKDVRYSQELQLTVGADSNPWKTEAMASETTTNNDGTGGEDTHSDPY